MNNYDRLTEELIKQAPEVPAAVDVIGLAEFGTEDRLKASEHILRDISERAGIDFSKAEVKRRRETTVFLHGSGGRATVFHASGAVSLKAGIDPFSELFDEDPGSEKLTAMVHDMVNRLGIPQLVNAEDRIGFERLFRIKAAGSDPGNHVSKPVLCRAIGAYRQAVRDLPVLGRASAHVELTGGGNVNSLSVTSRRLAHAKDEVLAAVEPRDIHEAAAEVAARVSRMLGGAEEARIVAESFRFGYVDLGRRRAQSVLAPMYVAAVRVEGSAEQTRSAHLVVVAGSVERFLKMPAGSGAISTERPASLA